MKTRKIEKHKVKSGKGSGAYQNALTRADLDAPPKHYSCVEVESIGKSIYFRPIPADIVIRMRDPQIDQFEQLNLMMELIATCVVDPSGGSPLMPVEEWRKRDLELINEISGAILGMQIVVEDGDIEGDVEITTEGNGATEDPNGQTTPTLSDETDG